MLKNNLNVKRYTSYNNSIKLSENSFIARMLHDITSKYKPMGEDEEKDLLNHFSESKARELLVLCNVPMVISLSAKFCINEDPEEVLTRGLEGLCYAAYVFDFTRGLKFATYAPMWILNRIMKPYQQKGTRVVVNSISLNKLTTNEDNEEQETTLENFIQSPENMIKNLNLKMINESIIDYAKSNFSEIKYTIFEKVMVNGDKLVEIYKDLKLSYSDVILICKEIRNQLKNYIYTHYKIESLDEILID